MNCTKIKKLIYLYKDDDLSTAEKNQLEKHLNQCESCKKLALSIRGELENATELIKLNSGTLTEPDYRLTEEIIRNIKHKSDNKNHSFFQVLLVPQLRYSLALITLFLLSFFLYEESETNIRNLLKRSEPTTSFEEILSMKKGVALKSAVFLETTIQYRQKNKKSSNVSLFECIKLSQITSVKSPCKECKNCESIYRTFNSRED